MRPDSSGRAAAAHSDALRPDASVRPESQGATRPAASPSVGEPAASPSVAEGAASSSATEPTKPVEAGVAPTAETLARWQAYPWQLVHDGPQPPHLHMALDEVLLDSVADGLRPASLRIWEWDQGAVVLGRFQSVRNEVDTDAAREQALVVTRRITGGGAMFVVPGNVITYSVYAPEALVAGMSFADSYAFLDAWVVASLRELGVNATYRPLNDLSSDQGKIGGAAQTRRRGVVLHHVTMAYDHNTPAMLRVLRIGKEKLSDKGTVSADKRVTPLRQQTQLARERITDAFVDTFRRRHGLVAGALAPQEVAEAERRVAQKFGTTAWVHLLP